MRVLSVHHHFLYAAVTALIFSGMFFFMPTASAGTLALFPSSGTYTAGDIFTVTVSADPQNEPVYMVEARLVFDSTKLAVTDVSKTAALSVWSQQPTYSNEAGTFAFGGGSPNPLSEPTDLLTITFKALPQEGPASISVAQASMRSPNDAETETYSGSTDADYMIAVTSGEAAAEPAEDIQLEASRTPHATSHVFSDPDLWYAVTEGMFTWEVPADVARIAFDIATSSEAEPQTPYEPPVEQFMVTADLLVEGVQYFALQYKYPEGWGETYHHAIRIDTVPPDPFTIQVYTGNASDTFPLLVFDTHDETSGLKRYVVFVDNTESAEVSPEQAHEGYTLRDLVDGNYSVRVVAEDLAGNMSEATTTVSVTAGWQRPEASGSVYILEAEDTIILLLLCVVIGQWLSMLRSRRARRTKEEKLRKEIAEVQDQMEKIFGALRDEIYDQINSITKRKRLSVKEKEAVASLNQALEVSESMIEKEVIDVKKILK